MTLVESKITAAISKEAEAYSDDRQFDILADDVSDALEMGMRAVVENLQLKFPTVQFTVS